MNRPSHWILALFAVLGLVVIATGRLSDWLASEGRPASTAGRDGRAADADAEATVAASASADRARSGLPADQIHLRSRIEGRVIDRFGWPVAGVDVRLLDTRVAEPGRPAVRSAVDGSFSLDVDGLGRRRVRFATADQVHVVELVSAAAPTTVVLPDPIPWQTTPNLVELAPTTSALAGETAVETSDGEPAVGAWVGVRETGVVARTDRRGRARLPLRPDDTVTLIAWDDLGSAVAARPTRPARTSGLVPLPPIELQDGYVFRGTLRDEDGEPVPAPVRLHEGDLVREVASDEHGAFAFRGLVGGAYQLEVMPHRGVLGLQRPIEIARDLDLDIRLERDRPLQVRVIDRKENVLTGMHVVARDRADRHAHGVTDREGAVMMRGLGEELRGFEVRNAELEPMRIESWTADRGTLVVAMP